MTTVRASAASSIIAIFGTLGSSANAASKLIDQLNTGVDMLDRYVTTAKTQQELTYRIKNKDFLDDLINESAVERAKKLAAMEKEISQDQAVAKHHASCISEYKTLFAAELNPAQP